MANKQLNGLWLRLNLGPINIQSLSLRVLKVIIIALRASARNDSKVNWFDYRLALISLSLLSLNMPCLANPTNIIQAGSIQANNIQYSRFLVRPATKNTPLIRIPPTPWQHINPTTDGALEVQVRVPDLSQVIDVQQLFPVADKPSGLNPSFAADSDPSILAMLQATGPKPSTNRIWPTVLETRAWLAKALWPDADPERLSSDEVILSRRSANPLEKAVLLSDLLMAKGIPVRVVVGLRYQNTSAGSSGFVPHAWLSVWCGQWVSIEPSIGPSPEAFFEASSTSQLALADAGRLHLVSLRLVPNNTSRHKQLAPLWQQAKQLASGYRITALSIRTPAVTQLDLNTSATQQAVQQYIDLHDPAIEAQTQQAMRAFSVSEDTIWQPVGSQNLFRQGLLLQSSKPSQAQALFQRALEATATADEAFVLGQQFAAQKRFHEALQAFDRVEALDPAYANHFAKLSQWQAFCQQASLLSTDTLNSEAAWQVFVLAYHPEREALAQTLQQQKRLGQAQANAQKAPKSLPAWQRLANLALHQNQLALAAQAIDHALQLAPKNTQTQLLKAQLLAHTEDWHNLEALLNTLTVSQRQTSMYWQLMGEWAMHQRRYTAANQAFLRAEGFVKASSAKTPSDKTQIQALRRELNQRTNKNNAAGQLADKRDAWRLLAEDLQAQSLTSQTLAQWLQVFVQHPESTREPEMLSQLNTLFDQISQQYKRSQQQQYSANPPTELLKLYTQAVWQRYSQLEAMLLLQAAMTAPQGQAQQAIAQQALLAAAQWQDQHRVFGQTLKDAWQQTDALTRFQAALPEEGATAFYDAFLKGFNAFFNQQQKQLQASSSESSTTVSLPDRNSPGHELTKIQAPPLPVALPSNKAPAGLPPELQKRLDAQFQQFSQLGPPTR